MFAMKEAQLVDASLQLGSESAVAREAHPARERKSFMVNCRLVVGGGGRRRGGGEREREKGAVKGVHSPPPR
jgi:hypothetical protein